MKENLQKEVWYMWKRNNHENCKIVFKNAVFTMQLKKAKKKSEKDRNKNYEK